MNAGEPGPGERPQSGIRRRRRSARRTAIDILYQADVMDAAPSAVLEEWRKAGRRVPPYGAALVAGVEVDLSAIDRILGSHAEGWAVYRMAAVDRTILRVACYELRSGVPAAVAISEAVEAAKELSTEDSGRFINGILGRVVKATGEGPEPKRDRTEEVSPRSARPPTGLRRSRPPSGPS